MKGRGVRTITPDKVARGDARRRGQDALRADRRRRGHRKPQVRLAASGARSQIGFDKLIEQIAAGRRDEDAFATLAARLAALDRRIGDRDRARVASYAGVDLAGLAARLLDAVDPDTLARRVSADLPAAEQKRERLKVMLQKATTTKNANSAIVRY